MEVVVNTNVVLGTVTCYCCGVTFGMPSRMLAERKNDKKSFWCPNGHSQAFCESELERLKKEFDKEKARTTEARAETERERNSREKAERRLVATKGVVTRLKNRVAAGTCPCCDQAFPDLAAHMAEQHAGYVDRPDEGDEAA